MRVEISQAREVPLRAVLESAVKALAEAGIGNSRLDAELLLAAALDTERTNVIAGAVELSSEGLTRFGDLIARRAAREPLAYILGRKEFFSLEFEVTPAVLIPRPETEMLVGAALEAATRKPDCAVLDLGTGSGAIALALAANAPRMRIVATDVFQSALEIARRNAVRLGLGDRIEFRLGDCWTALGALDGFAADRFDLVVSNPPYIEDRELERLEPEVARFEPRMALAGGIDGLDFYRRICARIGEYLKPGGELMVEVGAGQAERVAALCRSVGCAETILIKDLAGWPRVVCARFN
jgi:release factor glutamine methyltransferase